MKNIKLMTNTDRVTRIVDDNKTPKQFLTDESVDFSSAQTHLDGAPLSASEMNTPFGQLLGASDTGILAVIVKLTNA